MTKTATNAVNKYEELLDAHANNFIKEIALYDRKGTLEERHTNVKQTLTTLKLDFANMLMGMHRFDAIKSYRDFSRLYDRCFNKYFEVCIKVDDAIVTYKNSQK